MLETLKESSKENNEVNKDDQPRELKNYEKLYNLAKERKENLKNKQLERQKEIEEKEIEGCTFTPTFFKFEQSESDMKLTEKLKNFNENKDNHVIKNRTIDYTNIFQSDKDGKTKKLSHKIIKKNLKYNGVIIPSNQIVSSSTAYNNYIEKIQECYKGKLKKKEEILMSPGYGNVWKKNMTVPKYPNFLICGEKPIDNSANKDIKSLDKTFLPEKFSTIGKNTDNFSTLKDPEVNINVNVKNDGNLSGIMEKFKNSAVKIENKILFSEAQKLLHDELFSMKI